MDSLSIKLNEYEPIYLYSNPSGARLNINEFGLYEIALYNHNTILQDKFLEIIKTNNLTIEGVDFCFTDLCWDFRASMKDYQQDINLYKYNFEPLLNTNDYYITLIKFHILNCILEDGLHRGYIKNAFTTEKNFILFIFSKGFNKLEDCTINVINEYIFDERLKNKERTLQSKLTNISRLMYFYYALTGIQIDNRILNLLNNVQKNKIKQEIDSGKTKLLPIEFMNEFIPLLFKSIFDKTPESLNDNEKIINRGLGLIYIATQTGIRPYELLTIPYDCIRPINANGLKGYKLIYYMTKNRYGDGVDINETLANEKTVKVINHIHSYFNSKYLGDGISNGELRKIHDNFIIKNAKQLKNISTKPDNRFNGKAKIIGNNLYINIPILKQYRVYFDTELKRRGYNALARAKLLGHHDERMIDYYSRTVISVEEDITYANSLVTDIINDKNLKILGQKGDAYTKRIRKFINENKIHTKSVDILTKELTNTMPIRVKLGGCCIKMHSDATCRADIESDELLCAYGLCSNQCHFYYNLPYYYDRFKEGVRVVEYNISNGFLRESEKELYKLQNLIIQKLIPELDDLKRMIDINGEKNILIKHKNLEMIINNLELIEEEIEIWKTKNI